MRIRFAWRPVFFVGAGDPGPVEGRSRQLPARAKSPSAASDASSLTGWLCPQRIMAGTIA